IRYGAWYLDPKMWRKQKVDEPLKAPEVLDSAVVQGVNRRSSKSRQVLLQLLGLLRCRFSFLFIKKLLHLHAYYTVKWEDVVHALEGSPSKYKTEELKVTKIMPQATDW
uniref:Uncharacterized protein n=1 Tax=Strix occidentalis caurina TaxID=311401 RepID=A0A8D0FGE5_STROC